MADPKQDDQGPKPQAWELPTMELSETLVNPVPEDSPTSVDPARPAAMPSAATDGHDVGPTVPAPPLVEPSLSSPQPAPAPPAQQPLHVTDPGADQLPPGTVIADRYRLEQVIDGGGMGTVYKATHLRLHVHVAIKLLHAHVAARPEAMRRFRREAHVSSRINHPNVVQVLDFGEEGGRAYIAMEYIPGISLADWLWTKGGPPPLSEVGELFLQVVSAFEAAHALGVVHRDLKPENVMLTQDAAGRRLVKVVDFGLAHIQFDPETSSPLTRSDQIAGTPWYMSPEQCRSLVVGHPTDIYALGCLLTTLLQLNPPFHNGGPAVIMTQHMYVPAPPLSRPPDAEPVPLPLERLRIDMLAKLPERRPHDAAEVRRRFEAAMSPGATESQFPGRKQGVPLGDRAGRTVVWENAPLPRSKSLGPDSSESMVGVALLRDGGGRPGGVDENCIVGLATQSVRVDLFDLTPDAARGQAHILILDAGADLDQACRRVAELKAASAERDVIVCVDELTTEGMNRLIEAGAADVARYPVRPGDLAKKIVRVGRKRR